MPEKTALTNIDKGIQNITQELKKDAPARTAQHKEMLSTWGSMKTGFDAFNVSIEHDEENKITWGKLGGQVKDSVSEWYKQTKEMDNMLGKTFRMGSAIWENINTHLISNLKTAFSNVTAGVREVLGPVAEAFDAVKNVVMGVFGFFKGLAGSIFGGKVKPEEKVRNKFLQQIVGYFKDEGKAKAREGVKKKMPKPLAMLLFGLGIVIGAIVAVILAPFRLLLKILKPFKFIIDGIWKLLKPIRTFFNTIGTKIKTFIEPITKLFGEGGKLGKVSGIFKKMGGFLKPLVAGFKIGFRVLGWPLTILLGIIDAIKGIFKARGEGKGWGESLVAGLKAAVMGFINPFIDIFGWVFDKILGIFGVETDGTAKIIKDFISKTFDWLVDKIKTIWGWVTDPIGSIKKAIMGDGKVEENKGFDEFGGGVSDGSEVSKADKEKFAKENEKIFNDWQKRLADEKVEAKRIADEKEAAKKLLEESKKTADGVTQIKQTTINNQTTVKQIPDEVDGSLVGLDLLWDF